MKSNTTETAQSPDANWLTELLRKERKGTLMNDASAQMQALLQAVRENARKGSLTITLTVAPANGEEMVSIVSEVSVKAPKSPAKASIYYLTDDNLLSRNNPNQEELALSVLPGKEGERQSEPVSAVK